MGAIGIEAQIVEQWAVVYDAVYQTDDYSRGPDFAGWRSSITGENYSPEETAEWLDGTVAEIMRLRPTSVLEVGVGSGLLTAALLPHLRRYVGTDISAVAVARASAVHRDDARARFLVRAADHGGELGRFDLVIFNSVIHHFPSVDYLRRALGHAVGACAPGGAVFVGDVPSLPARNLLYLCQLAVRSRAPVPAQAARDLLTAAAARERELVIDPAFFPAFAAARGMAADIQLKPGRHATEMNLFRYDVRLRPRTDALIGLEEVPGVPWHPASVEALLDEVVASGLPGAVTGIPRPELAPLAAALTTLNRLAPDVPVDLARLTGRSAKPRAKRMGRGIVPVELVRLAAERGLACYCTPAAAEPTRYDAVLAAASERGGRYTGLAIADGHEAGRPLTTTPFPLSAGPRTRR